MSQDKLVIQVNKESRITGWNVIKISKESYDIIMSLKEQTGLPPNKIISLVLDFAVDRLEIQET